MRKVGLTGGIASGKSAVSRLLASYGALVIDADLIARQVVEPGTPGLAAVVDAFGAQVLLADGALDRPALGRLVFTDPAARACLNAIVHPLVAAQTARRVAELPADAVVVHDIPLLVENGLFPAYDDVVVVSCSPATQLQRLVEQRGLTPAEAQARIDAQAPLADKLAVATHVIDNEGTLDDLATQVERLWRTLSQPAAPRKVGRSLPGPASNGG